MCMENKERINWLLVITVFLFLISVGVVIYKVREAKLGEKVVCNIEGKEYLEDESFVDANGNSCVCSASGFPVCENEGSSVEVVEESLPSTDNLKFSEKYLNSLNKEKPDYKKINVVDITQSGESLKITIEREEYCSEDNASPNSAGFYELKDDRVIITTVTGRDKEVHTQTCLLSSSFEVNPFTVSVNDAFLVIYRNERGEEIELDACAYKGVLYSENDVFSSEDGKKICGCDQRKVECK